MRRVYLSSVSRRSVTLLGAMLLALGLVVMAVLAAASERADAATRTVTKTFSNQGQIGIAAGDSSTTCISSVGSAAPYPSQKSVAAFPRRSRIKDINLALKNFSHSWPDDVDVLLAHRGANRTIISDMGTNLVVRNVTLNLNDEAASVLPDASHLGAGSFRPANYGDRIDGFPSPAPTQNPRSELAGFDGSNPSGTWNLFVRDDGFSNCGEFAGGWSITIKAAVPS